MNAVLSPCRQYRYALWRDLQPQLTQYADEVGETVLFVMLNPSTADASKDDQTIRRCVAFARREGFVRLAVGNLYALRSTDPAPLRTHPDPVGPLNDSMLATLADDCGLIIVAWGAGNPDPGRVEQVLPILADSGRPVCCLGLTSTWQPRHPLYVPSTWPLVTFEVEVAA